MCFSMYMCNGMFVFTLCINNEAAPGFVRPGTASSFICRLTGETGGFVNLCSSPPCQSMAMPMLGCLFSLGFSCAEVYKVLGYEALDVGVMSYNLFLGVAYIYVCALGEA